MYHYSLNKIDPLERLYVKEVLDNGFRASKKNVFVRRLEQEFAKTFGVDYAIALANCTCAVHTALAALGVGPGDEVIVPALTMSSPAMAVLHNNSIPVFADVDAETFNIDAGSVRRCITPRTKAIISVALYGLPPDYDALLALCDEFHLYLIEDNAQCINGTYKGKVVGSFGHFACYSFQGSKHLTAGEGGMLITRDAQLAEKARKFSGLGFAGLTATGNTTGRGELQKPAFERHLTYGFNYKMPELCAAVALAQMQRSSELIRLRKQSGGLYNLIMFNCEIAKEQARTMDYENCYWTYAIQLQTTQPGKDWSRFKKLFIKNGGEAFYGAWQLTYNEPLFRNEVQHQKGVWQRYQKGLCPTAEYLQPRMIQLKTNYLSHDEIEDQASALALTLKQIKKSKT